MVNVYREAVYLACKTAGIPVFDYWVTDEEFPYVIISNVEEDIMDMKVNTRQDYLFTIDVFEKSDGKSGIVDYTKFITDSLREIDGIGVRLKTRYFSDVQPQVSHGIITLEFIKYEKREVM